MADDGPLILAAGSMLDHPASTLVEAAASAGFDGIGLRLSGARDTPDLASLRAFAAERGIFVHDVEVYRIGTDDDPGPLIEQATAVGATAVLVVSDLPDVAETVVSLRDVVDRCGRVGLQVGLEYMAWTTPDSPTAAASIASEVGCRLVVDLLHHVRVGAGRAELSAIVDAGLLGWVQLCDAPRERTTPSLIDEARHGRLAPGRGELPLRELLRAIPAGTPISVEVQSDELTTIAPVDRAELLHHAARTVIADAS